MSVCTSQPPADRLLDIEHQRVAIDGRTACARTFGERLRQVGRLDVAVVRMKDAADQSIDVAQRPEFRDLRRRQKLHIDADGLRRRRVLVVLVHAIAVHRQAQVADLGEADRLAGFGFQFSYSLTEYLCTWPTL